MILYLVTGAHPYTPGRLRASSRFRLRILSYNRALRAKRLPRATYIFSDMDRLGFWELELAARLYRCLAGAGMHVLNDPARFRHRYGLLRTLKEAGFNDFDAVRLDERRSVERFPVFLRTESAHRGVLSDLLSSPADVDAAVERALSAGVPLRELLIVEYCAEPLRDRLYRKLSVYRVGDTIVPWTSVHESRWNAKHGEEGIAGDDLYEDEYETVAANRYADAVKPAFALAEIAYGRADFGIVGGRPQVYEINSNPNVSTLKPHPSPRRMAAARLCGDRLDEAFAAIDTPAGGPPIPIDDPVLTEQRWKNRWMTFAPWVP